MGGSAFSRRTTKPLHPIPLVAVSSQPTGRTRICVIDSREASASSAMRLSARRSRRQSSRLIFCITITYACLAEIARQYSESVTKYKSIRAAHDDVAKAFVRQARFENKLR